MSIPDTPATREEMYLSAIANGDSGGIPETPYTRKEMYLEAIATGDPSGIPETPYTREEMYLDEIARNGGGGGGDITVVSKSISANGTHTAPSGKAYSPVTVSVPASAVDSGTKSITSNGDNQDVVGYAAVDVAVPNSYAAGDEGKVVSNGELVAQTAHAEVTQNGTIDTTLNNSVVVNVSGGGDDVLTWTQLATVDCSANSGNIELTNLNDYTAFFFVASGVQNGSTTASSYALDINDIQVNSTGIVAIAKSGTTQYQQSYVKFNGLFWEFYIQGSTVNQGYLRPVNLQGVYHYVLNVGKATSIKLTAPQSSYQATSGTITIYGGK